MTTKEKILKASLQLFNTRGVSNVTVRDIAKKIGISHGNLCYHYPNVNDVIWALYNEMLKTIDDTLDALDPHDNPFQAHTDAIKVLLEVTYEYRFFYLHIVEIMQRVPAIKQRHRKGIEERKIQIRHFWQIFRENGLFRNDLSAEQYERFIGHCFLYGDFWISNCAILYSGPASQRIDHYLRGYLALFMPYLTDKGKLLADQIQY